MSPIFDDALRMAHPEGGGGGGGRETASFDGQAAPGKLELMRLDEEGRTLETALRLMHRDLCKEMKKQILLHWPLLLIELVLAILLFAKKYEIAHLPELLLDGLSDESLNWSHVDALGLAIIGNHPRLAIRTFAAWDNGFAILQKAEGGTDGGLAR